MKSAIRLSMLVALTTAMLWTVGCKKDASLEDVCAKFAEGDEIAECVDELRQEVDQCANKDDVLNCILDAEGDSAIENCFRSCELAEGGGE